ncbi:MAG: glycosyltransferase family 2 protein [Planctomycetota bacterium]
MSDRPSEPIVTVVVPTRNRPELIRRAVRSALAQTLEPIEVVVVLDGPDDATLGALARLDDPRLRVEVLPEHLGIGAARNAGARAARGPWVAYLDDDDEWLPEKLARQLETAERSRHRLPVVSCRVLARSGARERVWPRRPPRPGEDMSDYLLLRRTPFWGDGLLQGSTLFTRKELLERVPWPRGLPRHNDVEWMIRASRVAGVGVEFVPTRAPLSIWYVDTARARAGRTTDWRFSLEWARRNRELLTPRAYRSFLLTWVSLTGARSGEWCSFWRLIREALADGPPGPVDLAVHLGIWFLPERTRRWFAERFAVRHETGQTPGF